MVCYKGPPQPGAVLVSRPFTAVARSRTTGTRPQDEFPEPPGGVPPLAEFGAVLEGTATHAEKPRNGIHYSIGYAG